MSEKKDKEFVSQNEFEEMWTQARHRAGLQGKSGPSRELFIYPILVLYAGFFFGPFGTALMAMATLKWRVPLRQAAIFTGLAGTTWFIILGVTEYYLGRWSAFELQFARSTLNFLCGMSIYTILRLYIRETHSAAKLTLHRTIAATIVLVALFFIISPTMHITLGR